MCARFGGFLFLASLLRLDTCSHSAYDPATSVSLSAPSLRGLTLAGTHAVVLPTRPEEKCVCVRVVCVCMHMFVRIHARIDCVCVCVFTDPHGTVCVCAC